MKKRKSHIKQAKMAFQVSECPLFRQNYMKLWHEIPYGLQALTEMSPPKLRKSSVVRRNQ